MIGAGIFDSFYSELIEINELITMCVTVLMGHAWSLSFLMMHMWFFEKLNSY